MWYTKPFFKNIFALILILIAIYLIYSILPLLGAIGAFILKILYPFIIAFLLYYLLRPIVEQLRKKMPLALAILIVYFLLIGMAVFVIAFVYPIIMEQISLLKTITVDQIQTWSQQDADVLKIYGFQISASQIKDILANFLIGINTVLISNLTGLLTNITDFLVAVAMALFILYYLFKDGKQIHRQIFKVVQAPYKKMLRNFLHEVDDNMSRLINGRLLISAITSGILFISFLISGINYPMGLTIISFIFYIIPTVGPFIAMIPVVLVGFAMSPFMGVVAILITSIAMALEGFIITPKIIGDTLYIHPITVIFILLVAGYLFGIFGLLLATPAYVLIQVLVVHLIQAFNDKKLIPTIKKDISNNLPI